MEHLATARTERRRRAIAAAVPLAAPLIAKADRCLDEEAAAYWTEKAYQVLARHGLDFAPDTIAAIDAHLANDLVLA